MVANCLIGRDLQGGGYYRVLERSPGMFRLTLKRHANDKVRHLGPYRTRAAAGRAASKLVIAYWEEIGGKGWHPGKPKP